MDFCRDAPSIRNLIPAAACISAIPPRCICTQQGRDMNTATVRRPGRKSILATITLIVISFFTVFAQPASVASAASLSKGPGYMSGVYWVGGYVYGSYTLFCEDPLKPPATPKSPIITSSVPGATTASVAKLNYVMTMYGTKTNPGQVYRYNNAYGAAVKLATWTYTGNKPLADKIKIKMSASVQSLLKTMLANAEAYYGPYKIVSSLTAPTLGKPGVDTLKLVSIPTGRALPGQVLNLVAANAKLAAIAVSTGATGVVKVSFTKTAWADVRITATSKDLLPSASIRLWNPPSSTYQRFLSAAPGVKVSGFATYHASPTTTGLAYACDSNCKGIAPISFTTAVTNTYGGTARFVMIDNGVARADYLQLAPGASGNKVWMMADKHSAQIELQVLVNGIWVKTLLANRIVVDCPPWPSLAFDGGYDCDKGVLNLKVPAGTHAQRIIVNGVVTQMAAGQTVPASTTFSCKQANSYSVLTSVQRTNGTWNTSPAATFAFPAVTS